VRDVLRHLLAILLLPFLVVVVVPHWLLRAGATMDTRWGSGVALAPLARAMGVVLFLLGFGIFAWCVSLFARVGRGTLAPWDPTHRLVAVGPYRHVRNPMISGVAGMLAGEALLHGSRVLAGWFTLFVLINHVYFLIAEEPGLERRFGEEYRRYRSAVPRWIPRTIAWNGDRSPPRPPGEGL